MVHVARPVGIDPRHQRNHPAQFGEVVPVENDPRGPRHGGNVDRVIGRSPGGEEADRRVDDRLFVDDPRHRAVIVSAALHRGEAMHRRARDLLAQEDARRDEGRAGNVETHHLHHHLVGIGGAVKRAGAGRMIAGNLAFEQLRPVRLTLRIELPHRLFLLVRDTARHGAAGHEDRGQMAEAQRADHQAGHDLVANAEQRHPVIHLMAEGDAGAERDHVAAEEREFHPVLALRHPVAHRRSSARNLRGRADLARPDFHPFGVAGIGLMGGQHIVIGSDDAEVGALGRRQRALVLRHAGIGVGEVGARNLRAIGLAIRLALHQLEIAPPAVARIGDDALGDAVDGVVERLHAAALLFGKKIWRSRRHGGTEEFAVAVKPRSILASMPGERRFE